MDESPVSMLDSGEFKSQTEGTLISQLPQDMISGILQFRPAKVGRIGTQYVQKFCYDSSGAAGLGCITCPWTIALPPDGGIIVVGHQSNNLQFFTDDGVPTKMIKFEADDDRVVGPAPVGLAIQRNGNLVISEYSAGNLKILSPDGTLLNQLGFIRHPFGLALDSLDQIYVADGDDKDIKVLTSDGNYIKSLKHEALLKPTGVTIGEDGTVVVIDNRASNSPCAAFVFDSQGTFVRTWELKHGCFSCAIDCAGNILVPCINASELVLYSPLGETLRTFPTKADDSLSISPMFVAIDKIGNLYISDFVGCRLIAWALVDKPE